MHVGHGRSYVMRHAPPEAAGARHFDRRPIVAEFEGRSHVPGYVFGNVLLPGIGGAIGGPLGG